MACWIVRQVDNRSINGLGCLNKDVAFCPAASQCNIKIERLHTNFAFSLIHKHSFNLDRHETHLLSMNSPHPLQLDGEPTSEAIENEIRELEVKLAQAKLRLKAGSSSSSSITVTTNGKTSNPHQDTEAHETSHGGGAPETLSSKSDPFAARWRVHRC